MFIVCFRNKVNLCIALTLTVLQLDGRSGCHCGHFQRDRFKQGVLLNNFLTTVLKGEVMTRCLDV
jgi:hypothetical protein